MTLPFRNWDRRNKLTSVQIERWEAEAEEWMLKIDWIRNCNLINECNPDFIAYGRSGFRGYIVFGFCKKNLFILESIFPNNATYIFESDWEGLSKLTKSEILNHNLQKGRLIHNANWPTEFEKYMNADG